MIRIRFLITTPAVCDPECARGTCIDIDVCFCYDGWFGDTCKKCTPAEDCLNGYCFDDNECACLPRMDRKFMR